MSERNAYNAVRRLVAERDQLRQDLAAHADPYSERNQAASAWMAISKHPLIGDISTLPERGTYAESVRARLNEIAANTSLPEPDASNPEHLRWMAKLIRQDLDEYYKGSITPSGNEPNDDWEMDYTPAELYKRADALDAARSAEREREQRIEQAAKVLAAAQPTDSSCFGDHNRSLALALDAAGLLRGGRGE